MIKVENVSFKYKSSNSYEDSAKLLSSKSQGESLRNKNSDMILKNMNLSINDGEVVSIIGKNGSREVYASKDYSWAVKADSWKSDYR